MDGLLYGIFLISDNDKVRHCRQFWTHRPKVSEEVRTSLSCLALMQQIYQLDNRCRTEIRMSEEENGDVKITETESSII